MAVESSNGGMSITGEHIYLMRYLTIANGLAMTINTGMKMSNRYSPITILRNEGITNKRTNKGALKDLVDALTEQVEGYEPSPSVKRALGK